MSIHFNFDITNPFVKKHCGKTIFFFEPKVSKNKAICFQFDGFDWKQIFEIGFWWRDKTMGHWGMSIEFGLLGFWFNLDFYDIRHVEEDDE